MKEQELLPHLFRAEYRKIIAVLSKLFGLAHIEIAEDIVSETFLLAAETWGIKGLPQNPTAWLYTVSKNKALDYLKRNKTFTQKIATELKRTEPNLTEMDIDLSSKNIDDSQLQMMFAVCHPIISAEAQIGLSLNLLCGFGVEEIADAFLTNKETIYKRLSRAKDKLKEENIKIEFPASSEIKGRLENVLTTLYLLFSEGYYSSSRNTTLHKDFCVEAMRLNLLLLENESTNIPSANALLALMCFHSSRFEARIDNDGHTILYEEQDDSLWNKELMNRGEYYLNRASVGSVITKYHLEAAIAYWHTQKRDTPEKWEGILQLYNKLLQIEYSPIVALNRTYALAKANGNKLGIAEAEKLNLVNNHLYHSLLGNLYKEVDNKKALDHYLQAYQLAKTDADRTVIGNNIEKLER